MICNRCTRDLPDDSFYWKNKAAEIKHKTCKQCKTEYSKAHYLKNAEAYKERANKSRPGLNEKGKQYIIDYLKNNPCVDCGISDIRVLQFDHREPLLGQTKARVGIYRGSIGLLKKEIAKCDVVCANCHMIRTAKFFGWERI